MILYVNCCDILLYFSRYCSIRLKIFSLKTFLKYLLLYLALMSYLCESIINLQYGTMSYLCEKYYKLIAVQYYVASCVSWVPRLTLLDLRTCFWNWLIWIPTSCQKEVPFYLCPGHLSLEGALPMNAETPFPLHLPHPTSRPYRKNLNFRDASGDWSCEEKRQLKTARF